jgi:hypothetical protein
VVGPKDGRTGFLGSIGVRFMIDGVQSSGGFSLVERYFAELVELGGSTQADPAIWPPSQRGTASR